MTGIFAPTISENNTAIQPLAPVQDNTAGQAIAAAGNLLFGSGGLFQQGNDAKISQRDKDRADLKPVFERFNELKEQQDQLGPAYRSTVNRTVNQYAAQFPDLRKEIVDGALTINGINVGEEEFDANEALYAGLQDFYQTPAGQMAAAESIAFNDDGTLNVSLTQANVQKAYLHHLGREVDLASMNQDTEARRLAGENVELLADENARRMLPEQITRVKGAVKGLMAAFKTGFDPNNPQDAGALVQELNTLIAGFQTALQEEAVLGGFNTSKEYDINTALAPAINLKTMLESNLENVNLVLRSQVAKDTILFNRFVDTITGIPGSSSNKTFIDLLFANVTLGNVNEVEQMLQASDKFFANQESPFSANVFGAPATPTSVTNEDGTVSSVTPSTPSVSDVVTPESGETFTDMSDEEIAGSMKSAFSFISNSPVELLERSEMRQEMVNMYGRGLSGALHFSREGSLDNKSMKRLYNARFVEKYSKIISFGDQASNQLSTAVAAHFSDTIEAKALSVENIINGSTGGRGFKWSVEGGEVILRPDVNDPSLSKEVASLVRNGYTTLPEIVERLTELENPFKAGGRSRLPVGSNALKQMQIKVNELNELISLNRQFPDLTESLNARVEERFKFVESDQPTFVNTVRSKEEYDKLPSGSVFMVEGDTGEITMGVKE